jgi:small subunit ribosomal protein S15e
LGGGGQRALMTAFFLFAPVLGLLSFSSVQANTNQSVLFSLSLSYVHTMNYNKQPKDTSEEDALVTDPSKKTKKAFKKFSYRGVDLEQLLELKTDKLVELFCARQRRRFRRGLGRKPLALVKKLRKAKREVQGMDKPETIRTHLRNMIIVPEMIGAIVGVYNGKVFNTVEIKPEMVGTYLAEYAITYKPISHGRAGIGGEKFVPLK